MSAQHVCSICGYRGAWTDEWQWYGSYKEEGDGQIVKMCSAVCRAAFDKAGCPPIGLLQGKAFLVSRQHPEHP